ncbi:IclR family transcriptional regulator [Streptomyces triticirhizae]|uniref:IclR family transcriptional regulator n=1 Tax=Streptomyces triticirhizae TaxID=2483353 RepID=A0A3M2M0F9_9ACTN|nr:IclR family transcriptional regulator [Streptomyces triticirhizae]RMI43254.1 IclR family transcriptional regulator [Streptomyces triticirhizae]RMI44781.1 IclR family transcriptional regulator [Streptomyces triticirhizae]
MTRISSTASDAAPAAPAGSVTSAGRPSVRERETATRGAAAGWSATPPPYSLASVDNALRLIHALDERGELRVCEAAELLGVARSTAHRLLSTLCFRGFATQRGDSPVYRPGPALVDAGLRALSRLDLRQIARPQLRALADETGETVHLVVLEGNGARFVDGVESTQPLRVGLRVGMVLPAHATAAGKAILAALPPERVTDLYPRGVQTLTDRTLASLAEIQRHLATVAQAGHATNHGESADDVAAVGVVIRDQARHPVGAVALAAPAERLLPPRIPLIAQRMHRAAGIISGHLLPGATAG